LSRNIGPISNKASATYRHSVQLMSVIVFVLVMVFSKASAGAANYKLKAAYIYQFTKFTHWPKNAFEDASSSIRICVLGKNPFEKALESFSSRTSQKRNLQVEYLTSITKLGGCHVVFISKSEQKELKKILQQISHQPVLSVSDINGFAKHGGIIGLMTKKRKVGIEINVNSSQSAKITLSSKLLEVATLINKKPQVKIP